MRCYQTWLVKLLLYKLPVLRNIEHENQLLRYNVELETDLHASKEEVTALKFTCATLQATIDQMVLDKTQVADDYNNMTARLEAMSALRESDKATASLEYQRLLAETNRIEIELRISEERARQLEQLSLVHQSPPHVGNSSGSASQLNSSSLLDEHCRLSTRLLESMSELLTNISQEVQSFRHSRDSSPTAEKFSQTSSHLLSNQHGKILYPTSPPVVGPKPSSRSARKTRQSHGSPQKEERESVLQLALKIPALRAGRDMIRFVFKYDAGLLQQREQRWETMILTHWNQYNSLTTGNLVALVKEETALYHLRLSLQRKFFLELGQHTQNQRLLRASFRQYRRTLTATPPQLASVHLQHMVSPIHASPVTPQQLSYSPGFRDVAELQTGSPSAPSTFQSVRDQLLHVSDRIYANVSPQVDSVLNNVSPRVASVLHQVSPKVESAITAGLVSVSHLASSGLTSSFGSYSLRTPQRERESGDGSSNHSNMLASRPQEAGTADSQPLN